MNLRPLPRLIQPTLQQFKDRAFTPALPHLLPGYCIDPTKEDRYVPAIERWFCSADALHASESSVGQDVPADKTSASTHTNTINAIANPSAAKERRYLNERYLLSHLLPSSPPPSSPSSTTSSPSSTNAPTDPLVPIELTTFHTPTTRHPSSFTTTHTPLSSFIRYLAALTSPSLSPPRTQTQDPIQRAYVAQHALTSLPPPLHTDTPTPAPVLHAGKGDIYATSLWLGAHPTYTPLHRDPNDNLFVQVGGRKEVRVMSGGVGSAVVIEGARRARMGGSGGGLGMRGEEMMVGREREEIDAMVWGGGAESAERSGAEEVQGELEMEMYTATLGPGDACFIPRGWWHSVQSVSRSALDGTKEGKEDEGGRPEVICSLNWWFR